MSDEQLAAKLQTADEADLQDAHRQIEQLRAALAATTARAEAAEAALAAVPRNEIKQLYIATITPSDPERYANHRRVAKWLFPDSEVQP